MLFLTLLPSDDKTALFEDLVERYEKKIFNMIFRLVGDYDEAADLTQDTFVSAYRSMDRFRGEADIYTWLYRIALNCCKNRFKYNDRKRSAEGFSVDGGVIELVTDDGRNSASPEPPHLLVERKELKKQIEQAINHLPDDYRIVMVLRDIQGMSYQQVANSTGLTLEVVKTRLARARMMLRRKLEPYFRG